MRYVDKIYIYKIKLLIKYYFKMITFCWAVFFVLLKTLSILSINFLRKIRIREAYNHKYTYYFTTNQTFITIYKYLFLNL